MKHQPANFTWDELNHFMNNMGMEEFDYDTFKLAYDLDPVIQALVDNFDENGVELKTKAGDHDAAPSDAVADRNTVSTAAKRATNKAMA